MLKTDVVIITARGRHDWISSELSRMGLNAVVLDVTDELGAWAPEDWEGPFGVFKSERISETQIAALEQDAAVKNIQEGFVLWPKTGPLELKGPLSSYQYKNLLFDTVVKDYIASSENVDHQTLLESERAHILEQDYKNVWLAHLAHTFAAPTDKVFPGSVAEGHALPLYANYAFRKPQRRSHTQSRKPLEAMGHFYHQARKITALEANGKELRAIECETVANDDSTAKTLKFEANYFIWLLSRQETEFLNKEWSKQLFASPTPEPLWTWTRYRFHFKPCRLLDSMPDVVFMLDDSYLSFTHENFLGLVRADKSWDVWLKVAFHRRADKSYLQSLGQIVESRLKSRIAGLAISHIEYPQNFHYDEIASSPFVVYEPKVFADLRRVRLSNLFFGGMESQEQMDWTGFFERQNKIIQDIITDVVREREKLETKSSYKPEELT